MQSRSAFQPLVHFGAALPLADRGFTTWAIKDFSVTLRQQITAAARRRDCTTAEWLHGYFQQHCIDGQQFAPVKMTTVEPLKLPVAPVDDLCKLAEAAARVAETADRMPRGLRASLTRGLREAARDRVSPLRPRQPPQRAIAHATEAGPAREADDD